MATTDVVIKKAIVLLFVHAIYSSIVRTRKYYSIKFNLWKMSKEKKSCAGYN